MATWIRADGRVDQVLLPNDSPDRMLFIQKCVGGYYAVISLSKGKAMLVNEDAIPMDYHPILSICYCRFGKLRRDVS